MAESDISLVNRVRSSAENDAALAHATQLIFRVCHLAGTAAFSTRLVSGRKGRTSGEQSRA
jgi:hypothetical protein